MRYTRIIVIFLIPISLFSEKLGQYDDIETIIGKTQKQFEKESDYQEFFDKYGDIPSKWRAPDFETNAYFYDLNNIVKVFI